MRLRPPASAAGQAELGVRAIRVHRNVDRPGRGRVGEVEVEVSGAVGMVVRHGVCFVDAAFGANGAGRRRRVVAVALVDHAGVLVGAAVWTVEAGAPSMMAIPVM
jgi:hypothetical protein